MVSFLNRFRPARPPRVVVHVGMHKTGTSSIQDTFFRSTDPELAYVDWTSGNHSPLFVLLFEDPQKQDQYHIFRNRGAAYLKELPQLRAQWLDRVRRQVRQARGKTVVFSAEDSSAPKFEHATQQMQAFFAGLSEDVRAVGYARHPKSFIQSAFQQNLRGGIVIDMERKGLRPNYRKRFEKIDRYFGPDNVILREFHRDRMTGGDVVQDFASTIGITPPSEAEIIRSNPSMSLEATALLYVQRKYGRGLVSGFVEADAANNWFLDRLSKIGQSKLVFCNDMLAPLMGRIAEDVAWMEARLGTPFADVTDPHSAPVTTMYALSDIALDQFEGFVDMAKLRDVGAPSLENLAAAIDQFQETCYAEWLARPKSQNGRRHLET
ncbi:MAG: hypothetical protein AAFY35_07965 [Pseudomonadota bacterium]